MIDVKSVPCLREHFEQIAAAEQKLAGAVESEVKYARAPDGPGFQPAARAQATQRKGR